MSIAEISKSEFEELLRRGGASAPAVAPLEPLPSELEELHQQLRRKRQVILQGPPGVGKTFTARRYISWLAHGDPERARLTSHLGALPEDGRTVEALVSEVESSGLPVVWDIVQFHPSYTYEDFIRGLVARPLEQGITFEARDKVGGLMAAVAKALSDRGSEARAVLVIDEINRGDISKIFGELIYGLEYRDQPVASPYSVDGSSEIVIPSNLDFIGTMNTADRSIALVDYALRRRFVFLDIQPDRHVIEDHTNFSGAKDRDAALWLFDEVGALFSEAGTCRSSRLATRTSFSRRRRENGDAGCEALATRFGYEIYPLLLEYEAEGRFERNQLDALLIELGVAEASPESRPRQREMTQARGGTPQVRAMEDIAPSQPPWRLTDSVLEIREGETLDAEAELIELYEDQWAGLGFQVNQPLGGDRDTWRVRIDGWAGVAQLPTRDGYAPQLQIRPKLDLDLFFLADYAFGRERNRIAQHRLEAHVDALRDTPTAHLIAWFLAELESFILRHLRRDYIVQHEVFEARIRGRLLMSDYLQRYVTSGQSHRAPCQFFEFTRDNLANQILKRSLRELRRLATLLPLPSARRELCDSQAAEAGDDRQALARDVDVDSLEVVLTRAPRTLM